MTRELKRLDARNLDDAVALAKHYRALNQPDDAESICRDVLTVDPTNQEALATLGLALTDQFPSAWMTLFDEACATFAKLTSPYKVVYFTGIAWERYAKAQLAANRGSNARHAFEQAIERFEQADRLGPADEPGAILHYNRCVRALQSDPAIARSASVGPGPVLGD